MTGLKQDSQVMVDKTIAVPRSKITGQMGAVNDTQMKEVDSALRVWLELA